MSRAAPPTREAPRAGAAILAPWAIVGASVAIALALSKGATHVPPSLPWLVVPPLALLAGLLAGERLGALPSLFAAATCGFASGHVLLAPSLPRVHDLAHLWGIYAYGRALADGSFWPLWLPNLGAGMPLPEFYGPLNLTAAAPWILSGLSPASAWRGTMLAAHVASALSAFAGARLLGSGSAAALVASAAYAFAPWRLTNVHVRGAIGEVHALAILPILAALVVVQIRSPRRRWAVALFVAAGSLVLVHLLTAVTASVALAPVAVWAWTTRDRSVAPRVAASAVALPLALAVAATAFFWLPAIAEKGATSLDSEVRGAYFSFERNGIGPRDLLERRAWDRLLGGSAAGSEERMPFYAGLALLAAGLGASVWRRREAGGLGLGAAAALVCVTPAAAAALAAIPAVAVLQFPWRFLSPATALLALAVGLGAERALAAAPRRLRPLLAALAACAFVLDGAPYTGAADRLPAYRGTVHVWTEDRDWTHWDRSMHAVPVTLPTRLPSVRVVDLALPPDSYDVAVDLLMPAYPEWLNPEIVRRFGATKGPADLEPAGVSLAFLDDRPEPVPIAGDPYASIDGSPTGPTAIDPARVRRRTGRVEVSLPASARGTLVVLEQSFPGWRVSFDGGAEGAPVARGGFLSAEIPPGVRVALFRTGWTTGPRRAGLFVSLIGLVAGVVWMARRPPRLPR